MTERGWQRGIRVYSHYGHTQVPYKTRLDLGLGMSAEYMVTWFGSIFAREGQDRARRPSVDGSLALILAMAVNIEAINLHLTEVEPLALLCELMCFHWHVPRAGPSTQAFGYLKTLKLHGSHTMEQGILARMDPCVNHLHIYDCPLAGAVTHAIVGSTQLSVLELANVEISSSTMESMFEDPALCNLREIKLTMLTSPDESWESYDFSALSAILVAQFPDLQAFECTYPGRGNFEMDFSRPFGSFKQLTKLHTLRLDLDLLIDDGRYDVFDHDMMLPSSLGHLSLTENAYVLDNFPKLSNDKDDDEALCMVWKFITDPAPSIGLETFTLKIYTDEDDRDTSLPDQRSVQPDHAMRQRLQNLASNATKRGLAYNAIEYEVDFEQRQKRWVGLIAGCTSVHEEGN
jgi:hypothetical protein